MNKWFLAVAFSVVQTTAIDAAPAFFKDSLLHIREGIVVLNEKIHYYRNLRLEMKDDGDFRVLEGEALNLASVDELSVAVIFTEPRQAELNIKGQLSTPCADAVTSVERQGDTFYVAVAENVWQTFDVCAQVLAPYDVTLELDVADLEFGDYLVRVNDEEIDLELE